MLWWKSASIDVWKLEDWKRKHHSLASQCERLSIFRIDFLGHFPGANQGELVPSTTDAALEYSMSFDRVTSANKALYGVVETQFCHGGISEISQDGREQTEVSAETRQIDRLSFLEMNKLEAGATHSRSGQKHPMCQ